MRVPPALLAPQCQKHGGVQLAWHRLLAVLVKDRQAATGRTLGCNKSQHASAPGYQPTTALPRAPSPHVPPDPLSPMPLNPGLPTRCLQTSGPGLSSPAQMSGHHLQASSVLHHTVTCAPPPYTPDPTAVHLHSGTPTASLVPYTHYGPCALQREPPHHQPPALPTCSGAARTPFEER